MNNFSSILFFIFSDINECENVTCQHGSVCVDEFNGFYCNCTTGYDGPYCENGKDQICFYSPSHEKLPQVTTYVPHITAYLPQCIYYLPHLEVECGKNIIYHKFLKKYHKFVVEKNYHKITSTFFTIYHIFVVKIFLPQN